jgi:putative membrane protein
MRTALIFSLVIAIIAVVFALQNPQPMEVNLLFAETRGSAALILLVTFALGVVVGLLSTLPSRIRDKREIKKLKKGASGSSLGGTSTSMPSGMSSGAGSSGSSASSMSEKSSAS